MGKALKRTAKNTQKKSKAKGGFVLKTKANKANNKAKDYGVGIATAAGTASSNITSTVTKEIKDEK